jgi:hypothetical protein
MSNPSSPASPPPAKKATAPEHAAKTSLTDAEISARSTKHATWVTAGVAILAAIIALGGAVWSGVVSAHASDRAAKTAAEAAVNSVVVQSSRETDRSRAEFLRDKQQALYSTLLAHDRTLFNAMTEHYKRRYDPANRGKDLRVDRAENNAWDEFDADYAMVQIIASPKVRDEYQEIHSIYSSMRYALDWRSDDEPWNLEYKGAARGLDMHRKAFFDAARADMGNR